MIFKSNCELKYSLGDDEDTIKFEVVLVKTNKFNCGFNDVYYPKVKINDYDTEEYDELVKGSVNAKFSVAMIVEQHKKKLLLQSKNERKKYKIIKETIK